MSGCLGSSAQSSLFAGEKIPGGDKLKGWTLSVFWKRECKFFDGIVVDYDGDLDQHTIHYSDGTIFLNTWAEPASLVSQVKKFEGKSATLTNFCQGKF